MRRGQSRFSSLRKIGTAPEFSKHLLNRVADNQPSLARVVARDADALRSTRSPLAIQRRYSLAGFKQGNCQPKRRVCLAATSPHARYDTATTTSTAVVPKERDDHSTGHPSPRLVITAEPELLQPDRRPTPHAKHAGRVHARICLLCARHCTKFAPRDSRGVRFFWRNA